MPKMVKVTMTPEAEGQLKAYLRNKIDWLKRCHQDFHQNHLPRWRKMYDAVPAQKVKQFPWPYASNVVSPLVGIHTDTLHARVMAALFKTIPLWVARAIGKHENIEELRSLTEEFMNYVGIETSQMNLYPVYNAGYLEAEKVGTAIFKAPWVKEVEKQIVDSGSYMGVEVKDVIRYDGPRPEKCVLEDFFVAPQTTHEDKADFIAHRIRMVREDLERRKFLNIYDADRVNAALAQPSRTNPSITQQAKEEGQPVKTEQGYGWAEWDVWECHLLYNVRSGGYGFDQNGTKGTAENGFVRLIATYHYESNTLLRTVYNFYPENMHPFVAARLGVRDDAFYGRGMAEMLEQLQESASTVVNQRLDNATMANIRFFTVRNGARMMDSFRVYPGAMIPVADQEDFKERQLGDVYNSSFQNEQAAMQLAERRSGVSPPMQGMGAGTMQGKRGVYTALGTMSMLQEGNRRTDLIISDLRYSHINLGRKCRLQYAAFGIPDQILKRFGERAAALKEAFKLENLGVLDLPITAATASINREVERQNQLMLANQLGGFYQTMSQLMIAVANPQTPPEVARYLRAVAFGHTTLERKLLRLFDEYEVDRYVPEPFGSQSGPPQVLPQPGGESVPGMAGGGVPPMDLAAGQPFYQRYVGGVPGSGDLANIGPNPQSGLPINGVAAGGPV